MAQICTTININMDRKCAECGKGGAADSGICLGCTAKAMRPKPMRSAIGKAVQKRMRESFRASHGQGPFRRLGAALDAAKED